MTMGKRTFLAGPSSWRPPATITFPPSHTGTLVNYLSLSEILKVHLRLDSLTEVAYNVSRSTSTTSFKRTLVYVASSLLPLCLLSFCPLFPCCPFFLQIKGRGTC
jgi:hypothetical protein